MYKSTKYTIRSQKTFRKQILRWAEKFQVTCILDSHREKYSNHSYSYSEYDIIVAAGAEYAITPSNNTSIEEIDLDLDRNKTWLFGFLTYDLKNNLEDLTSKNTDFLNWPDFYFFKPQIICLIKNKIVEVMVSKASDFKPKQIIDEIRDSTIKEIKDKTSHKVTPRLSKEEYINRVEKIREHILRGDIYEVNFCQEFYSRTKFKPYLAYERLNALSPTPFSCFFRLNSNYLISASPERFLKKNGTKLISQPIKGTTRRGTTNEEDIKLIHELKNNQKEKSENTMIVDLVRNDLSRIAIKNSVKVEDFCSIFSFKQVHQMISTISAETLTNSLASILKATFPMGSMTGAPKINAMILSEKYETTKRGLYSGAVGYITPNKDFDFNVVIRSLQYNSENNYLSYMVGGAITYLSDANMEYEECLIKAKAITTLLKGR